MTRSVNRAGYNLDMKTSFRVLGVVVIAGSLLVAACYGAALLAVQSIDWRALKGIETPVAQANAITCGTIPADITTPYPPMVSAALTARAGSTPECGEVP
jgi:hypothetical protein